MSAQSRKERTTGWLLGLSAVAATLLLNRLAVIPESEASSCTMPRQRLQMQDLRGVTRKLQKILRLRPEPPCAE